jgi:hypothetical protein
MNEEARFGDRLQASGPGRVAEASVGVPGDHTRLFAQTRILQQRGQWREADRCDGAVLVASPDHFRSLCRLAMSYGQRARIIHVRRDPVDTCFSCFSLLFSEQPHT